MVTVFILSGVWDYEGTEVLGVFADRRSAEIASSKWLGGNYDRLDIAEWKVEKNSPPSGYFGRQCFRVAA